MGNYLPAVQLPLLTTPSKLKGGFFATAIITESQDLFMWGKNAEGQLGIGNTEDIGDEPNEMGEYLQPVNLGTTYKIVEFSGGRLFSCAILDNYGIKCWGYGLEGQVLLNLLINFI